MAEMPPCGASCCTRMEFKFKFNPPALLLTDLQLVSSEAVTAQAAPWGKLLYLDAMNCAGWFFGAGLPSHPLSVQSLPARVRSIAFAVRLLCMQKGHLFLRSGFTPAVPTQFLLYYSYPGPHSDCSWKRPVAPGSRRWRYSSMQP